MSEKKPAGQMEDSPEVLALLELEETATQAIEEQLAQPTLVVPDAFSSVPEDLEGYAEETKIWHTLTQRVASIGLLNEADIYGMIRYCFAYAEWLKAARFIRDKGSVFPLYETRKEQEWDENTGKYVVTRKNVVKNWKEYPQVKIASRLRGELLTLEKEFGLTPTKRLGLQIGAVNASKRKDGGNGQSTDPFKYR